MNGKDKPRIRFHVPQRYGRDSAFWVCRASKGYPGIGSTPLKAWHDWAYINGIDKALQPAASPQGND